MTGGPGSGRDACSVPVRGAQLRSALGLDADAAVPLAWIRETVLEIRARKGMVLDEDDHDTWSAGSFFQNALCWPALVTGNQRPREPST